MKDINWFIILLNCLAGLVLFLYGVTNMSDGLKSIASEKMKSLLSKSTSTIFAGIVTGTIATTLLDSSSVVIIMVISMVNAEILTSRQSFGIILGSNIGTTIGSQIIAFNIGEYSTVLLLLGFILFLVGKSEKIKHIGKSILGIGLIFFGLHYMSMSIEPLKEMSAFSDLMLHIENPYKGALTGALTTVAIQSSSATIAIVISLANQNLISFSAAVAVMLGAEIGTCTDTLFATIGRSREAVRSGVFHLVFSLISAIIGILFISPFIQLVNFISGNASPERHIANAHLLFNILAVLLFIGFVPLITKGLHKLIPDTQKK